MGKPLNVPIPSSIATGAEVRVPPNTYVITLYFSLIGTAAMTVQFEYSGDGVNWTNAGAALSANGFRTITDRVKFVRADTTAHTSGDARGRLVI